MTTYADADEASGRSMWVSRWDLGRRIRIGVSYHRKREWFYDALDKSTKAIAVICASSALVNIAKPGTDVDKYLQLGIVVTSTLALVLDWSNKARLHSDFAARYSRLEREVSMAGEMEFSDENLKAWEAAFCDIEGTEPAPSAGLVQLCQDEIEASMGIAVPPERLTLRRKAAAHFGFGYFPPDPREEPKSAAP